MNKSKTLRYKFKFVLDGASNDINECSSVDLTNGKLTALPSLTALSTKSFTGIIGRDDSDLYIHSGNRIYAYDGNELQEIIKVSGGGGIDPRKAVYRGKIFVSLLNKGTYKLEQKNAYIITEDSYDDMTTCGERLFALRSNKLYFGQVAEEMISDGSDYVELPTACNALVGVFGKLYALGDVCYKLVPSADDTSFVIKEIARGIGEVYSKSIVVIGNCVIYVSANGIYSLTNDKVTRIFRKLTNSLNFVNCSAIIYRGQYLLSLPNTINCPTFLLDIDEERIAAVYGRNIVQAVVYNGALSAVYSGGLFKGEKGEYNDEMRYKASNVNFGTDGVKHLRSIMVKTNNPLDLYLASDEETRLWRIQGKNRVQRIPICGKGRKFSVAINSKGNTEVEYLELAAEEYKEINYGDI